MSEKDEDIVVLDVGPRCSVGKEKQTDMKDEGVDHAAALRKKIKTVNKR